jgi:hypothetical protein
MDDKTLNIVLWALGSTIALAGLLLGYPQYRRSGPPAAKADEEHPMLPIDAAHDEVVVDHPYVTCLTTLLCDRTNIIIDTR